MLLTQEKLDAMKRIKDEFTELCSNCIENIGATVGLVKEDDLFEWKCTLKGPKDTSYANGIFKLRIKFPDNYPKKQPEVCFKTPIYHVNINPNKLDREGAEALGHVCINTLNFWNPMGKIREVLKEIFTLFYAPNPDSPYGLERGNELRYQRAVYEEKIKYFTKKYASSDSFEKEYDSSWDFSYP